MVDVVEKISDTEVKITTTTVQVNIIKLLDLKKRRNAMQEQITREDANIEKRRNAALAEIARLDSAITEAEKQEVKETLPD
jgi:seryl-tRNA synthetase